MNPDNLEKRLRELDVPEPDPARMREARRASLAAFSEHHSLGNRTPESGERGRVFRFGKWAAGIAAGFALVAGLSVFLANRPAEISGDVADLSLDAQLQVLAEVERLFPGQLAGILIDGEDLEVLVSPQTVERDRPVVVEFRRGGRTARVLTFNGRRIIAEVDGTTLALDVLLTGEDQVILAGPDFVWTNNRSPEIAGFTIQAFAGGPS